MAPHLVVGNWKMNLGPSAAATYASLLREKCRPSPTVEAWIAPPFVSLYTVAQQLSGSYIKLGSQNVHWAESGAFTGEISPAFLKELSCSFAIVGHSERRHGLFESSEIVAKRAKGAIEAGLIAIICCGETKAARDAQQTEQVLTEQLAPCCSVLQEIGFDKVVIAYEPVWAIGTGIVASIQEIEETHTFIKSFLRSRKISGEPPLLYGGSVTPANFQEIIELSVVNGALVGGASLKVDQFSELIKIAGMARG